MKNLFLIAAIIIPSLVDTTPRYYSNDDGDTVLFSRDSIYIRINNHDGFNSYSLFLGNGIKNRFGKHTYYHIKTDRNNIVSSSFIITEHTDSCINNTITFEHYDGTPIAYSKVIFFNDDNCVLSYGDSDHVGSMVLDEGIMILSKRMRICSLGAIGEIAVDFKPGHNYHCRCVIPYPFIPLTSTTKITIINNGNHIILFYKKRKIKMLAQPFEEKGDSLFLSFFGSLM